MKNMKNFAFKISLIFCLFFTISCSDAINTYPQSPEKDLNLEQGITTVKMFVPDYYAIASQGSERVIAPQSNSVRLCYLVNGSWVGINTVDLSTATKTSVENAPQDFTGSVYTISFSGVPVGNYSAGNLKIELLDSSNVAITSGTNSTAVTVTKGGSASTIFYTVPETTGANAGNLSAGEMKFSRAALVQGVNYNLVLTSSGDYPDLVLFGSDGRLVDYYPVDSVIQASITLSVESTDVYYLGLWADDGNDIARYTLNFDFGEGTHLSGVLTGNNLHWTKNNSPYIVNANLLVEEGTELTIDEGVIVQFTGNYYLKVTGTISAVGTKSEPIIFVQSGDNLNNWAGISIDSTTPLNITNTYTYASGNRLKNCMVIGASTPLTLNSAAYVDGCTFTGNENYVNLTKSENSLLINSVLDSGIYVGASWYSNNPVIVNNVINTRIYTEYSNATFQYNTITNANFRLSGDNFIFQSNSVSACTISISDSHSENAQINGNNFLGYNDVILDVSNCSYSSKKSFNFTGNYWGATQTFEIEAKCGSSVADSDKDFNMSFINDYYDNFENTKIDFSNWATEPIESAGYQGEDFNPAD